jgi:hypothetical protein
MSSVSIIITLCYIRLGCMLSISIIVHYVILGGIYVVQSGIIIYVILGGYICGQYNHCYVILGGIYVINRYTHYIMLY